MQYRINTGCLQYFEQIDSFFNGPGAKLVYMTCYKTVGMFIITTEHDLAGIFIQQADQCFKIFSGAAFTDDDLHSMLKLVKCFITGKAFVIGADGYLSVPAGLNILPGLLTAQAGSVAVHRFTCL